MKRNTADCRKQLNTIIKILDELDKKQVAGARRACPYVLRIFIVMVLHGESVQRPSIVARFLLLINFR